MRIRSFGMLAAVGLLCAGCADTTADVKERSSDTDYCDLLVGPYETSSDDGDQSADDRYLDQYRDIAAVAPSDLVDDWEVLIAYGEESKAAYTEAGIYDLSDEDEVLLKAALFGDLTALPDSISRKVFRKWQRRMAAIDQEAVATAGTVINEDLDNRCGISRREVVLP